MKRRTKLKGSDNKENNYKQNATNLEYAQKLNLIGEHLTMNIDGIEYKFKFDIVFPMDKKAQCCNCAAGGSLHNSEEFCLLCPCKNYIKASISFFQCDYCFLQNNRVCYCTEIFDSKTQDVYREIIKNI